MDSTITSAGLRSRSALLAAVALAVLGAATMPADARGRRGGSGYGLAGGINPELALANVYSGIYGIGYTYDRAHYDFNACSRRIGVLCVPRGQDLRPAPLE